ncbi:MAG: hypothetical protein HWE24_17615 [Oceanospirillaceae bacterium]|nr:hypothetical protein [Oceanospirillaceae bacterium]
MEKIVFLLQGILKKGGVFIFATTVLYSQDYCNNNEVIHISENNYLRMDWYQRTGQQYSGGVISNKRISKDGGDDILVFQIKTLNNLYNAKMYYDDKYEPFLLEIENKEYVKCEHDKSNDNLIPQGTIKGNFRFNGKNPNEHAKSLKFIEHREYAQSHINESNMHGNRVGSYPYFVDSYDYSKNNSERNTAITENLKNNSSNNQNNRIYNTNTISNEQETIVDNNEMSPGLELILNIGKKLVENEIDNFVNGKDEWIEKRMVIKCLKCELVVSRYIIFNERRNEIKEDPDDPLPKTSWYESHNHQWVKANN